MGVHDKVNVIRCQPSMSETFDNVVGRRNRLPILYMLLDRLRIAAKVTS